MPHCLDILYTYILSMFSSMTEGKGLVCMWKVVIYHAYELNNIKHLHIPYLREIGPMGGAPYIGPRLGDGPIIEVSVSRIDVKESPGKLPVGSS